MVAEETSAGVVLDWADRALELSIEVDFHGVARLAHLGALPAPPRRPEEAPGYGPAGLPLLDVVVAGSGRQWAGRRYSESVASRRMLYRRHSERDAGPWHEILVDVADPESGLNAVVVYRVLVDGGVLQSFVQLTNTGSAPVTLESVTSFLATGLAGPGGALEDVELMWAENDWLAEGRWQRRALRDVLPDLNRAAHQGRSRGRFGLTSVGSWSSGTYLPMGAAANLKSGHVIVWQIEHNGAWHWQVGEHMGAEPATAYVALLGPTDAEHQWRLPLSPGSSFQTVPAGVALSSEGFEGAIARLTRYRRATRRPHADHRHLPVIFNDYMNTVMGDPTTERLLPLVSAAARAGAEYFCVDSGWYAEIGEPWWDTVGAWSPSRSRFPNGISEVLDRVRAEGMVPGLWIEPEVVGILSPVAAELPAEAFFTRGGERVVEQGRYHLDLRHPLARGHLDEVVDFLVGELGVGYLKMDYNTNVFPGTEGGGCAGGVGLLGHNRALLEWVDGILDRHPQLTVESCSSGGMRTDYGLLSHCQLHSTSDQQDLLRYPPIAAAAPVAVAPEQAAVWAYPQPEWDDDMIAFTLCSAMLGRVHLSGHLDKMTPKQQELVSEAISTYKQVRRDLPEAVPFWPLGLPQWTDPWVALGMRSPKATYLTVWRRRAGDEGKVTSRQAEVCLPLQAPVPTGVPRVLYPSFGGRLDWDARGGQLRVKLDNAPSACLIGFA